MPGTENRVDVTSPLHSQSSDPYSLHERQCILLTRGLLPVAYLQVCHLEDLQIPNIFLWGCNLWKQIAAVTQFGSLKPVLRLPPFLPGFIVVLDIATGQPLCPPSGKETPQCFPRPPPHPRPTPSLVGGIPFLCQGCRVFSFLLLALMGFQQCPESDRVCCISLGSFRLSPLALDVVEGSRLDSMPLSQWLLSFSEPPP